MATPSVFNFTYTKYTSEPQLQSVVIDTREYTLYFEDNFPNWVRFLNAVPRPNVNNSIWDASIGLNGSVLDNMPPGTHTANISLTAYVSDNQGGGGFGSGDLIDGVDTFTVNVTIVDNILLDLDPTNLFFTYEIGGSLPSDQSIQVSASTNWSLAASESWVNVGSSTGSTSELVTIGVSPSSLTPGVYNATLTLTDGVSVKTANVELIVTNPTMGEFLLVTPEVVELVEQLGELPLQSKDLQINSSQSWDATLTETWMQLSASSGTAGITTIQVSADSQSLGLGVYNGQIRFDANGIIKVVNVVLIILELGLDGIESDTTYFIDDRNYLSSGSALPNTFLNARIIDNYLGNAYQLQKSAPFFNGNAKILMGQEGNHIIKSIPVTDNLITSAFIPVTPMIQSLEAYEKSRFDTTETLIGNLSGVRFFKGKTPIVANRATYMPQLVYMTAESKIALAGFSDLVPSTISIAGSVTDTIAVSFSGTNYVYQCIVDLSNYQLSPGDQLSIGFAGQSVDVIIIDRTPQLTQLAFENEWNIYELFDLRGFLSIDSIPKEVTTERFIEGEEITRILESKEIDEFTLNTGHIFSNEESEWISRLNSSKRIYLHIKGNWVEVVRRTRKIEKFKTRKHFRSYNLKFRKAVV